MWWAVGEGWRTTERSLRPMDSGRRLKQRLGFWGGRDQVWRPLVSGYLKDVCGKWKSV